IKVSNSTGVNPELIRCCKHRSMGVKNIATSFLYFKDIPKIAFNQLLDINSNKIWLRCSYKHISPILR
ncbi:hypothetical protein, partial [Phocaeicola vulgatus]|uniref:hypothetical protein n=1 Tax=Phocaeicola vulgatus TaxID=821 RepID=UPI001E624B62